MALSHEDRLIKIERIEPNPMRDLDIYPITADRVGQLVKSYAEGDFGTIIPVRPHPTKRGFYQQACGHHRVRAMQTDGRPLEILCRIADRTDEEMIRIMVRENMNNYGNNPEAVADSVAAICKQLIYWLFLAEDYGHLVTIVTGSPNPWPTEQTWKVARGVLKRDNVVGWRAILSFFGEDAHSWPLSKKQVDGALSALNGTEKMKAIAAVQRLRVDRELAAKHKAEIARAEEAERKEREAAEALAKWEAAEAERKERRKEEIAAAKALKDEMERKAEEARLAQEKVDADKERRRMKAIEKEQQRLEAERKKLEEARKRTEAAQAQLAEAEKNAEAANEEPWLHVKAFGMFKNQGQFDAFRSMMLKPEMRHLFPVDQQVDIINAMLEALRLTDNMTAKGVKEWMTDQDAKFKAEVEARRKERERRHREMEEAASLSKRVDRTMTDFQANLARLSRSYSEVHELMKESVTADLVLAHPYAETLRHSLENQYKTLPEIEKLFRISARRVRGGEQVNPEEKTIN